jgi:subtilisin family serine protease
MEIKFRILVIRQLFILLISFSALTLQAQNWKSSTNSSYLKNLSAELDQVYQEYKRKAEIFALERDILMREVLDNGSILSLIRIMPSGLPEYYTTFNQKASENVGAIRLRPGQDLSLNLTGKNMLIGVWDAGSTNVEHQEFGDRVEIKDNIPFDDHGTHVAGTIAASGVNPQAKGMAYEANLFAYDFNNDNSERIYGSLDPINKLAFAFTMSHLVLN